MKENQNHSLYRCAIVDDDLQFVFLLSAYVNEIPKLQLAGTFLNPEVAMESIKEENNIDFLFLDIRMGNISGVDVAAHLRDKVKFIVFISASGEYALEALQVGGDQYLVKPVMFSTFLEKVNELLSRDRNLKLAKSQSKQTSSQTIHSKLPEGDGASDV